MFCVLFFWRGFFFFAWRFVKFKIIWPTCAVSQHESLFFSWGKKQEHIFLCYCERLSLSALELCLIWKICADSGLAWKKSWWAGGDGEEVVWWLKMLLSCASSSYRTKGTKFWSKKSFTFLSCLCFQMNAFAVLFKQHFDKEQRAQLKFLWVLI